MSATAEFRQLLMSGTAADIQSAIARGCSAKADGDDWVPIILAAANNPDPDAIRVLLRSGASISDRSADGLTPLMNASAGNKNPSVLRALIDAGASVSDRHAIGGLTPLMCAAMNNPNPDIIGVLLNAGAKPDDRDRDGLTALCYAARSNSNPDCITRLVGGGADVSHVDATGWTPLMTAAAKNPNPDVLIRLLQLGALVDSRDHVGTSALMAAALGNNPQIVSVLLNAGADATARTTGQEMSVLMVASGHAGSLVIDQLLRAGAKVSERDSEGKTPLMYAARFAKDENAISALLSAGAGIEDRDVHGWTALMAASVNPESSIIRRLLTAGSDVRAREEHDWTPLMWAALGNPNHDVTLALLQRGADPNESARGGWTPLICAAGSNVLAIVKVLVSAGANTLATNDAGLTPLMFAAKESKQEDVVGFLASMGRHLIGIRSAEGKTAYDYAAMNPALRDSQGLLRTLEVGAETADAEGRDRVDESLLDDDEEDEDDEQNEEDNDFDDYEEDIAEDGEPEEEAENQETYYDILGVKNSASIEEIRGAYRSQALKWHPDRHGGSQASNERFKLLAEAYSTLSEPEKRANYNRLIAERGRRQPEETFSAEQAAYVFMQEMLQLAISLTYGNISRKKIAAELKRRGCPPDIAERIAAQVESHRKGTVRGSGARLIVQSLVALVIGIVVTAVGYQIGFIVIGGGIMCLVAIVNLIRGIYFATTGRAPSRR